MVANASSISSLETLNLLSLRIASALLNAAHDFVFRLGESSLRVRVAKQPQPGWPATDLPGLVVERDGPWPCAVEVQVEWEGGCLAFVMSADFWTGQKSSYRHMVALRAAVPAAKDREVLWITLGLPLKGVPDGAEPVIAASITPFHTHGEKPAVRDVRQRAVRAVMQQARLPFCTPYRVEACRIKMPKGDILPNASEAFERLAQVVTIKIPFFLGAGSGLQGKPPFDLPNKEELAPDVEEQALDDLGHKRASIFPFPGGIRNYKHTLDALLTEAEGGVLTVTAFYQLLRERYDSPGETAGKGYLNQLIATGLCVAEDKTLHLTEAGRAYRANPTPQALFEILHAKHAWLLDVLVTASVLGRFDRAASTVLRELLRVEWKSFNQMNFRRNWLLSLGMLERTPDGDVVTPLGTEMLAKHKEEVDGCRARVLEVIDEVGPAGGESAKTHVASIELQEDVSPGLGGPAPANLEAPAWNENRVDLVVEKVPASGLSLERSTLQAAMAAISSGKHLLLVGPPGTGKTELALCIAEAARQEGYCTGAFTATASADWTTFDTIGGYALQKDGASLFVLAFFSER